MKNITLKLFWLFFLAISLFGPSLTAQIVNIPDANFKTALLNHTPVIDTNNDGEIQVGEAQATMGLDLNSWNIQDLTGIQAFTNITGLGLYDNQLYTVDLSQNTALEVFYIPNNQLTTLDLSQNTALKELYCAQNNITSLNLGQNTLLEVLYCQNNNIVNLDLSQNLSLQTLKCENNQITSLDLSQNTALTYIILKNNQLTFLDVRNGNNSNSNV